MHRTRDWHWGPRFSPAARSFPLDLVPVAGVENVYHTSLSIPPYFFPSQKRCHIKVPFAHLGLVPLVLHSSQRTHKEFTISAWSCLSSLGLRDNREEADKSEITQIESATDQSSDLQISAMREMQERRLEQYLSLFNVQKQWTITEKIQESKTYRRKSSEDLKELSLLWMFEVVLIETPSESKSFTHWLKMKGCFHVKVESVSLREWKLLSNHSLIKMTNSLNFTIQENLEMNK